MENVYSCPSIKIENISDIEKIKKIIFHPDIKDILIFLDDSNKDENFIDKHLKDSRKEYFVFYVDDEVAGILMILNLSGFDNCSNIYFYNVGIYKKFRGSIGFKIGQLTIDFIKINYDIDYLLAITKVSNVGAVCFSKKIGFEIIEKENGFFLLRYKNK